MPPALCRLIPQIKLYGTFLLIYTLSKHMHIATNDRPLTILTWSDITLITFKSKLLINKPTTFKPAALLALVFSVLLMSVNTFAADPAVLQYQSKKTGEFLGAIRGYDTVAYFSLAEGEAPVKGSDEFTHEWNGATWKFASAENRDKFAANPEAYAPQFGGYCAFAVSHGFTKPIRPDAWTVVNDKLYLNLNKGVMKKWLKKRDERIAKAEANWPTVLESCGEKCYPEVYKR